MTVITDLNAATLADDVGANSVHTAVLDMAHLGDIHGALGSIAKDDVAPRTTLRARLRTLIAILGPGLIVMVGDNDAGAFGDLHAGRSELRHNAYVDADAADPGTLREPGDGGAAWSCDRGRARG